MMIASNNSSICGHPLNVQFCCYVTTREKIRQNAFLLIYIFIPVCWSLVSRGNKTNRTGTDYCDLSGLDIVSLCACLSLIKQFWELSLQLMPQFFIFLRLDSWTQISPQTYCQPSSGSRKEIVHGCTLAMHLVATDFVQLAYLLHTYSRFQYS